MKEEEHRKLGILTVSPLLNIWEQTLLFSMDVYTHSLKLM